MKNTSRGYFWFSCLFHTAIYLSVYSIFLAMFFRPKVFTEYGFAISNKFWFYSDSLKKNSQVLIFCWWLPLLVKIDSFIFEVIIENYSQKSQKKTVSATIDRTNLLALLIVEFFKAAISCLREYTATENSLKMMKNAFYFT